MNNIVYHDIAFRSNKKINSELNNNQNRNKIIIAKTSYKNKEPKDSIPKMHIVSNNKYKNTINMAQMLIKKLRWYWGMGWILVNINLLDKKLW